MKRWQSLVLGVMLAAGVSVVLSGAASFPSSVKSFTTKLAGDTVQASHINDLQDEIVAVETDLLNGLQHHLLFTDNTYDIGQSGATRPRHLYLAQNATIGGTLGVTGAGTFSSTLAVTGTANLNGAANVAGALTPAALLDISGAAAGQVKFPGTQNASSNANTLDDYEEGSWTPVLGGSGGTSGQSYTTQVGRYVKVGKLVFVQGYALLSTKGTITTNAQVQGLPFPVENTTSENTAASIRLEASATALVSVSASAAPNTSVINIVGKTGAATSSSPLVSGDIGNTTEVTIAMVYRTDN